MPSNASGPTSGATSDIKPQAPAEATAAPEQESKPKGSPYDLVRVKNVNSGNEHTVTRVMADKNDDLKVLDQPAVNRTYGTPRPARAKSTNRTDKAGSPVQEA